MSFDVAKFNSLRKKQTGASIAPKKSGDFSLEKFQELREQNLKEKEKELDSKLSPREKKLKTQESRLEEDYGSIQSEAYQAASKAQSALQSAGGRLTSLDQIARDFNGLSFSDYGNMLNYSSALSDTDRRAIYNLNKDRIAAIDNEIKAIEEKAAKNVAKGVSADAAIAKMKDSFSTEALSAVRQGKTVPEKELSEYTLSEEERNNLKLLRETRDALVSANETYAKYGNAASLSYDELNKLRDAADKTDNDAFMHYQTLADNALTTAKMKKLSETKMEGTGKSVLDEAMAVAALEDGDEKDKRIEKLEEAFEKAGVGFDNWYSIITEDNNVSAGNFLDWMGNALKTGFLQGNSGLWGFLDMTIGGVLKGMGWEDNPLSTANKHFKNQAERAAYDLQRSEARMGNGDALKLGGEFISGMAGALPHAAQAYLQKYIPGAATSTTLASTAALNNASAGAKALMTAQNLISNPMWGTSFAQEAGGTWNEAKSAGASDLAAGVEALLSGGINATIETGLTGNSGIQGVMQNAAKGDNLLKIIGGAFVDEAAEEVLQGTVSRALGKMHGSKEEVFDLEAMAKEAAMGGTIGGVLGGLQGGIDYAGKAYANYNAAKSAKEAFRTLTKTESAVVDKILAAEVKEKEKGGKKLSEKQKTELRDKIIERMDRGEITVEEIENALGGETKSALDKLNEKEAKDRAKFAEMYEGEDLKKRLESYASESKKGELEAQLSEEVYNLVADSRLSETYNEQARKTMTFYVPEETLAKIDSKRRDTYRRAMEGGVLNNTRKVHELVDFVSKVEAEKGIKIDFASEEAIKKLVKEEAENVIVNGVVTKDGITVNVKSPKVLNTVVGHELVHVFKGDTKKFESLKKIAFELAETKGEYKSRLKAIDQMYSKLDGYKNNTDAIEEELLADLVGDYLFTDKEFVRSLSVKDRNLFQRIFDEIKYLLKLATAGSAEARQLEKLKKTFEEVYRGDVTMPSVAEAESTLSEIGVEVDNKTKTAYSLSSLNDAFNVERGVEEYTKARAEYENALAKSIAEDPDNVTKEELDKAKRYLDSLFLVGEMIANDRERLDYEAAVKKSAWVSNAEYGGSIDFSTLCAKRRVFTGTFDAIQEALPDTVLTENDFLTIRNLLLESGEEAPCSMCYVEGSRAKHGVQVAKFLTEYLKTNPDWKPQIADFASASRLEQTRIQHPEAYAKYQEAMNKLAQSKPKEASVRTDYKGEILKAFVNSKGEVDSASVLLKNLNGGIRFNSFSDFEIIHALDCMQVLMDMSRVGLSGQAYTKVKEFAEAFGKTGLKINLSLVAKGVDKNGKLLFDEINGMKHSDAIDLRGRYSENVGTVIVVFDEAQMKAALADPEIDYVLPFHRSQWRRAQYNAMGLPVSTKDFTAYQNDKAKNPKTGKWVNLAKIKHVATYTNDLTGETHRITGNIMPNQYWDYNADGRTNAQRYLNYINENGLAPKFRFLLDNVDGQWVLPEGEVGDNYYKLLIDFKMYNNEGWGSPQTPVSPDYNMTYIQQMLKDYEGGHNVFPVAQDVVKKFVDGKKSGKYKAYPETFTPKRTAPKVNLPGTIAAPMFSLSEKGAEQKRYGDFNITGEDVTYQPAEIAPEDISPVRKMPVPPRSGAEAVGLPSSVRYRANEYDELMKKAGVEGLPVETPVASVAETTEPMTEKLAVKDISFVKEPSTVTTETNVEEDGKNAEVLTEEPEVVRKERSKWQGFLRRFVDKFAIFEKISLDNNNRELQARADSLHRADSAAQYFMRHGNKKAGVKSVYDIRKEVKKSGKEQEFSDYMYHVHNIDRMSLESRAAEKIEGIRKDLGNLTDEQIVALSENKITKKTSKEDANKIRKAREFVSISDTKNKPVFGEYTAEDSRGFVAEFEQNNPEFKAWAKDVYNYVNYLRDVMVQEGIISQETADLWSKIYPHYVPIRRDGKTGAAVSVPLDTRKTGVNAPVKKATGGNSDILPLFDTLGARTVQTFNAIAKNRLGVELKNTLNKGAIDETVASVALENPADAVDNHEGWVKEGVDGSLPTFTVFEDGKRVTFEIPEDVYDALKPNDPFYQAPVKPGKDAKFKDKAIYALKKTPEAIGKFRRSVLTEYNPFFMLTNAGKDFQDVLVNSQHPAQTFYEMPNALFNLVFNGKWAKEFYENGGADLTLFERDTNTFEEEKTRAQKIAGFPFKMIPYANNIIEKVPRLAEYIASRKAKRSADVAMLDAARVTTNFAAGGYVTKFANKNGFTFLNASVQGFAQQVRNIREAKHNGFKGWLGLAAKYAIAGIPALVLNAVLWGDDDDYEELSDYVKQNYYVLWKNEDGTFVRFPKGRTLAVIQNGLEQMVDLATGDDEADFAEFARLFIDNLAPSNPLDNNIISPILQAATNTTWYGEDLVPTKLQSVPTEEQFDESTDAISKWIGEKTGISPYKLNYLFDQYSGVIGDIFLPTLTLEAERGDGNIITAPFLDKFTTDPVMKNQNVSDFYELKEELQTIANGSKATDSDILKAKYMADVNKEIADLNAKKREIQNNATLSDEKKYAEVRSIQRQIANLAEVANSSYEKVNVSGKYATVNGVQYRYYEPGEDSTAEPGWRKLSEKQIEKQNKVTKALGISLSEYWSKSEEYNYAFESPNNYAVSKTIGYEAYREYTGELNKIKSDTDAYGNAISGSRKNKVISYINGLDISAIEKVILYKNEYPSDNSYNNAIVNYLNNRNDLSYSDKEKILVALGIVKENKGAISW